MKISIGLFLGILFSSCSTVNLSLNQTGDVNDAISNAIIDYVKRASNGEGGAAYYVNAKHISADIIGVSILEYSGQKVFISKQDSIGSNAPFFPTRVEEVAGRLFYWYDSSSVITENVIQKLIKFDQIDSGRYEKPNLVEFSFSDNKRAIHYYFCKQNLTKFIRKESNIALGYGKIPKIDCK